MSESPPLAELKAPALFGLEGKVAVVTGGSRGMGKEICRALAAAGCDLVIASRKLAGCEDLARQIQEESPGRTALGFACNVNTWSECQALYDFAYRSFGKVDVLVNNAGGSPLYRSLKEITEDYFDKIIGLNLKGPFRLSALFGSKMCEQDGGSIINVSSESSLGPSPNAAVYAAAKAGLNHFTKTFAMSYGPKVRVNCIMPGPFLTDISKAWDLQSNARGWRRQGALMRAGRADEVVGAALYFASNASSFTTGAILEVTGMAGGNGMRDPDHKKNLDFQRDVLEKMRDPRLSKL
eukprot:CAMPEP_0204572634 /NCGR_PEP_ID=MMETSP0661-20131031/39574_1 /ASSEMBLY_ACC=CAM_ASM_000606 /TAXON_ID=109239 /ORGANISM="Alexandrium margalefi, Strain AMGDE01CS-322" /LENGTH=294 /DNA_ID=CAMNT_0051580999 /DNA_START=60 /DNA_END=944 /DNA_ORIENTATION=+